MNSKDEVKDEADTKALASLLEELRGFLKRYIVFPNEDAVIACTLWAAHTHAFGAFDFTPYLHIHSPTKECGKTNLFICLKYLCANPWLAIQPTEAVLFRKIDMHCPTLLLDETDTVFDGKDNPATEGIRAVLNSGFARGVVVPRCDGQNHALREFMVFCPKAFAGIGNIPETIASRSIKIPMERRRRDQKIEKLRERGVVQNAAPIASALAKWFSDPVVIEELRKARPEMPPGLSDRSEDICESLFAIADMAGGMWPALARRALVRLRAKGPTDDEDTRIMLLAAIREIISRWEYPAISSKGLLEELIEREGEPWGLWWARDVLNGNIRGPGSKLARHLKPFGIIPRTVRIEDDVVKGYPINVFAESFDRYLPLDEPNNPLPRDGAGPLG
jgi:hypothetical protein